MIDWPGSSAAAIPACTHLSTLETFRPVKGRAARITIADLQSNGVIHSSTRF
jgi:hypothetical protein